MYINNDRVIKRFDVGSLLNLHTILIKQIARKVLRNCYFIIFDATKTERICVYHKIKGRLQVKIQRGKNSQKLFKSERK